MKNIKKIIKSKEGYIIFITKEAKALGWDIGTAILLDTDLTAKKIVLKKIE